MTIGDILTKLALAHPERPALVADERQITYGELAQQVEGAAAWLHARGLRRGQAVLVFVPLSIDLYVALLAMFRLGVTALFLDPSAGRRHLEQCCARRRPDALLAVPKAHLLRFTSSALRAIPLKMVVGSWLPATTRWPRTFAIASAPAVAVEPEDPALVTFTSGSTGVPKGAVRTHGFLIAQHRALAPSIALEPGEVDLATLPVFTLANLASGLVTVLPRADLRRPGAVDGAALAAQIEETRVSRITASPAFFERLIAHGRKMPGLRKLYTGGAPVFPRLLADMQKLAPQAEVVAVYGSTEAEPIAHIEAKEIAADDHRAMQEGRGLLTGHIVPEIQLRILRDRWGKPRLPMTQAELGAETLGPGNAGEIVVTGDHVLKGYLGGLGDEETKFKVDGEVWHRTGDAGKMDEHGRLWLLGRCVARIVDAHGELYPFTVECVAMTFPEVRRAAALAHREKRLLVVEARDAGPELEKKLSDAVAWARIEEIRFLEAMPVDKRHNAKIDYPALRDILEH